MTEDKQNFETYNDQDAAVELARAKLKAIYGRDALAEQQRSVGDVPKMVHPSEKQPSSPAVEPSPAPSSTHHSPVISRQYQQEQTLQNRLQPNRPAVSVDHQLIMPGRQQSQQKPQNTESVTRETRAQQVASFRQQKTGKQSSSRLKSLRSKLHSFLKGDEVTPGHGKPLAFALITALVFTAFLNNRVILGQVQYYISPGDRVASPEILQPGANLAVSDESKIIIPKIDVEVPVVYDEPSYDNTKVEAALERGVVHYGQTALPGAVGNNVIVGHSSNSIWNEGKYKFAFVLLDRLNTGDTFMLNYEGRQYVYEVYEKRTIEPNDFSVVNQDVDEPIVTLITCTPPGTSWKRLIVVARQILPDPNQATQKSNEEISIPNQDEIVIPGTDDSFWDRARDWLF